MAVPKISAEQRMNMIMNGLNPLDPIEVKKFLEGYGISEKDKIARVQKLFENISPNLGGGIETRAVPGEEFNEEKYTKPTAQNMRQKLNEELTDYAAPSKTFKTDDFVSLREEKNKPGSVLATNIENEGFENAKSYLNLFIMNLKNSDINSSYKNRLDLFKALKLCLEAESKYKSNNENLKKYRNGVLRAEKVMLSKLG